MANKEFGIKEITLVGSSGSPTIQSPNNINLVANTVAISTNLTVGSDLTVTNNLTSNNITVSNLSITNVSGVVTASSFVGNLTGTASFATVAGIATYTSEWILGAVGSSDYTFTGPGFTGAVSDPDLYLVRGQQYKFTNTMGAHPFRIQSTPNGSTGTQYDDGIVNNNVSNGTLTWDVQFNAPGLLYYQCTAHGGMGGKIYIIDAGVGGGGESYWTETSAGIHTLSNVGVGTTNPTSALTVKGNTSLETLNVSGVSTFAGITTVTGPTLFAKQLNVSGVSTLGTLRLNSLTNVTNLGTSFSNASNIINFGNDLAIFNLNDGTFGNQNWILANEYPLYIGTKGETGGSNFYSSLITIDPGTDTFLPNTSNVKLGYGDNTTKLQTIGAGVTVTGTTFTNQLSVSGVSTFSGQSTFDSGIILNGESSNLSGSQRILLSGGEGGDTQLYNGGTAFSSFIFNSMQGGSTIEVGRLNGSGTLNLPLSQGGINVSGVSTLSSNVSVGGTISVDGGVTLATNNVTIVGTSATAGEIKRIGGAPFFYDGNAWREFVLSSGTPVTQPADTEWDNVVFRATFDDDFTDAKFGATPVFVSAGSSIVGAAVTIGTGAYRNDGSVGAGISYAYRDEYDFTGSWTIEFWMYVDSSPIYSNPLSPLSLISMHSTTGIGTSGNWTLAMWEDSFGNKYISWFNQNGVYVGGTTLYTRSNVTWSSTIRDKWNHFALVRESVNGSLHFYVNGQEESFTAGNTTIDNDILNISTNGLNVGGATTFTIGNITFNSNQSADVIIDDMRISCGVGTAGQRYTSIGISTYATFTPPTTALPTTGTLSSYIQPPGDKYGEITLGGSPTWRGTSGVTVTQQSSGNYRVSFASSYTNSNDYYVLSQGMDQGFASYVGIARSTTHVDLSVNRQSNDTAVDTGSLAVQIKNHI